MPLNEPITCWSVVNGRCFRPLQDSDGVVLQQNIHLMRQLVDAGYRTTNESQLVADLLFVFSRQHC